MSKVWKNDKQNVHIQNSIEIQALLGAMYNANDHFTKQHLGKLTYKGEYAQAFRLVLGIGFGNKK